MPSYTDEVKAFRNELATLRQEQASGFAAVNKRLDALSIAPRAPSDAGTVTTAKAGDAAAGDLVGAPAAAKTIVEFSHYRRGRTGALPAIVRTPAQLVADRQIMPFDRSLSMRVGALEDFFYEPGDYENLDLDPEAEASPYIPTTGERPEIGLVTDQIAEWLMGGSPNNMLVQAECSGSIPVHAMLDGRVIDHFKYPRASFDPRQSPAQLADISNVQPIVVNGQSRGTPVTPEGAHMPALCYVAYLATRDRYYLEELQFVANFHVIGGPIDYAQGKGIIYPWQQRQFAWGFRDLVAAYIATQVYETENPGPVPAPLLPSSYWKMLIDNNVAFYLDRYSNNPPAWDGSRPMTADGFAFVQEMGFLGCDDLRYVAPWQQDFISAVLGWTVWTGKVPQARPLYDFQVKQAVKRATGPLRSQAIQYNFPNGVAESWSTSLTKNGYLATPDGHYPESVRSYPDYLGYLRGALKIAVMNGVSGANEAFAYADAEAKRVGFISRRWSF